MFEIDETAVLSHLGLVGDVLTVLRLRGVQIAIDNLGTGSSSLFSLLRVPATHVKVDGHYVRDMLVDPEAMAVVCLGLDLSRRADLQFIATGVNSAELITALRQRGCDAAQGPYFIRPLIADEVLAYLATAPEILRCPGRLGRGARHAQTYPSPVTGSVRAELGRRQGRGAGRRMRWRVQRRSSYGGVGAAHWLG